MLAISNHLVHVLGNGCQEHLHHDIPKEVGVPGSIHPSSFLSLSNNQQPPSLWVDAELSHSQLSHHSWALWAEAAHFYKRHLFSPIPFCWAGEVQVLLASQTPCIGMWTFGMGSQNPANCCAGWSMRACFGLFLSPPPTSEVTKPPLTNRFQIHTWEEKESLALLFYKQHIRWTNQDDSTYFSGMC